PSFTSIVTGCGGALIDGLVEARLSAGPQSEGEPRRKLDHTRLLIAGCTTVENAGARNLAERSARDGRVRITKLGVIEQVEEIGADFQFRSFAIEVRDLADRKIHVGAIRPSERVSAQRAVGA